MVEGHTNWTTMFFQIIFLICSVCNTHGVASAASPSCASDEYRAGQLCCLACPGGYRVHRDCTATANTLCSKCPDDTFKEDLSGQKQCSACTKCDKGLGLKVKKSCSSTSDAVCEVLDGFFCSDSNRGGCRAAQRHRLRCSPGHYIGQRGTADKDTECLHCTYGTFSNGTSSCQPHTTCDSVEGVQIQPGTDSTDSTCIKYVSIAHIILLCISFICLLFLGALIYRSLKMERDLTVPTDCPEPTRDQQEHTIPTIPDETMDDQHDDQSPAPPSSSTHNGSVSVSVHQEDHQPVHIKRDNGASRSTPLSLMRSSTSQSAGERVSLLIDNIVAEAEVTPVLENRYQPGSESDD